jgi:undecaprenyl-diphosphatase
MILDKSEAMQAVSTLADRRAMPLRLDAISKGARHGRAGVALRRQFERLDAFEIRLVRHQFAFAARARLTPIAAAITVLGNGWLYLPLGLALFLMDGWGAATVLRGGGAVLLVHCVYPFCKRAVARRRPFVTYSDVPSRREPLDYYAFPSGHCMTVCAACLPVAAVHPAAGIALVLFVTSLGWSRVVLGHHYPSDIVAGSMLGVAMGLFVLALPF